MAEQEQSITDYTAMRAPQMLSLLGDNAALWAVAFCQHATKFQYDLADEATIIGWFANAIEISWDKRIRRAEPETRPVIQDVCIHGVALGSRCVACGAIK